MAELTEEWRLMADAYALAVQCARELSGVFHAITGTGGRFKTGEILDLKAEGIDVYNTILPQWALRPASVRPSATAARSTPFGPERLGHVERPERAGRR
ncbi:MAG TPA: hypothetical protein VGN57_08515 [Pirellulaceae bacterium]|nr:hypothetical protein [Pirellulaceae bacterium]